MHDYPRTFVAIALLFLLPQVALAQEECILKRQKDDLKVFTCKSGNEKFKSLKTEFILENTSFKELIDFVADVDNYVNWQYNTSEASVLRRTGKHSILYRTVVTAPWPASDREMIMEIAFQYDSIARSLIITSHSVASDYPENPDLVRIPFADGRWQVSSFNGSSLKIEWTLRVDPGGSVPLWIVNMAMAEGPYNSFGKVKETFAQRRISPTIR